MDATQLRLGPKIGGSLWSDVHEATLVATGEPLVVKLRQKALPREAYNLFPHERRARTLMARPHAHLVRIAGTGEWPGRGPFVAMERLDGPSAAGLPADKLVPALVQAARGVGALHRAGLVHGLLSPAKILMTAGGAKVIGTLGEPPLRGAWAQNLPLPPPGELAYRPADQIRELAPDAPADVFALAAIVYEAVCGGPPFPLPSADVRTLEYMVHRIKDRPKLVSPAEQAAAHGRTIAPALEAVLVKALHERPDRRYPNAGVLAEALAMATSAVHRIPGS